MANRDVLPLGIGLEATRQLQRTDVLSQHGIQQQGSVADPLQKENEQLRKKLHQVEIKMGKHDEETAKLDEQRKQDQLDRSALQKENEQLRKKLHQLEMRVGKHDEETAKLDEQGKQDQVDKSALLKENEQLKQKVKELEERVKRLEGERETLNARDNIRHLEVLTLREGMAKNQLKKCGLNSLDLAVNDTHKRWRRPGWVTTDIVDMVRTLKGGGNALAHCPYKSPKDLRAALADDDDDDDVRKTKDAMIEKLVLLYKKHCLQFGEEPRK